MYIYRDRICMCACHAPCAMDSSAMDSSAMDSSAMDSSAMDSSTMESSSLDLSAMVLSSVDSSTVDSSAREAALRKRRERDRDRRARESSEQREARLSRHRLADRERARARHGSETAMQREVRLARRRIADRSSHVSQSQSIEEREARLHQLRVKREKLELTNDAVFSFWSCFSPIVEQISESDHMTIITLLFCEKFDAEYSPTEIITKIYR